MRSCECHMQVGPVPTPDYSKFVLKHNCIELYFRQGNVQRSKTIKSFLRRMPSLLSWLLNSYLIWAQSFFFWTKFGHNLFIEVFTDSEKVHICNNTSTSVMHFISITCPSLTTDPSLQPTSSGSEILIFFAHATNLSKNCFAIFSCEFPHVMY